MASSDGWLLLGLGLFLGLGVAAIIFWGRPLPQQGFKPVVLSSRNTEEWEIVRDPETSRVQKIVVHRKVTYGL